MFENNIRAASSKFVYSQNLSPEKNKEKMALFLDENNLSKVFIKVDNEFSEDFFSTIDPLKHDINCLNMESVKISDDNALRVSSYISKSRSIKEISLQNIEISHEGSLLISRAIQENKTLTKVFINNCEIKNEAAQIIADSTLKNGSITQLQMNNSEINDESLTSLHKAITYNITLTTLMLMQSQISKEGAQALFSTLLSQNVTLKFFYVSSPGVKIRCEFDDTTVKQPDPIIKANQIRKISNINIVPDLFIITQYAILKSLIKPVETSKKIRLPYNPLISQIMSTMSQLEKTGRAFFLEEMKKKEIHNQINWQEEITLFLNNQKNEDYKKRNDTNYQYLKNY